MKQLAFLHIPKTGGRTMIELCRYFYRPDQCKALINFQNPDEVKGAKFVHSHFPYDSLPPTQERLTFTILREPGRRIASYYQMCLRSRPEHWPLYDVFWQHEQPMSILDFATNKIGMTSQVRNAMVRQLHSYELLTSERDVTEADVQIAIQHLSTLVVGFQRHYDAFVDRLCDVMSWDKPDYQDNNRSIPYQTDETILDEIRGLNRYDVMLYQWARENLDEQNQRDKNQ